MSLFLNTDRQIFGRKFHNEQAALSFVQDLIPVHIVQDCLHVLEDVPNASAWQRVQKHAADCGVNVFINVSWISEGGSWCDSYHESLKEALARKEAMKYFRGQIHAITFMGGSQWEEGGQSRLYILPNGRIEAGIQDTGIPGADLQEFLEVLKFALA